MTTLRLEEGEFTELGVPGWGRAGRIGQAALPALQTPIVVPGGVEVVLDYRVEESVTFVLESPIYPVQPLRADSRDTVGREPAEGFAYDPDYYGGAADAESAVVTVSDPAIARDVTLVFVGIRPFGYDSVAGQVTVATEVTFSLRFEDDPSGDRGARGSAGGGAPEAQGSLPAVSLEAAEADYLIIAAHDVYDPVDPDNPVQRLADWKQRKGLKSYVLQLPQWDDTPGAVNYTAEDIKDYISEAYNTDRQTSYVVLVGDDQTYLPPGTDRDGLVPSNSVTVNIADQGQYTFASDHPYACVTGEDILPDLTIGRLPVRTVEEATNVIDKILAYDVAADRGDWYDDALIAAFFEDALREFYWADSYFLETSMYVHDHLIAQRPEMTMNTAILADVPEGGTPAGTIDEELRYYAEDPFDVFPHRISMFDANGNLPDPVVDPDAYEVPGAVSDLWKDTETRVWWTNPELTARIAEGFEEGVGLVYYGGHGLEDGWYDPLFINDNVNALSNGPMTPVVFSMTCSTGEFDSSAADSFAEAMLKLPIESQPGEPSGGAVGMLAATDISWTPFDDTLTHGIFSSFWPDGENAYDPWRDAEEIATNPYPPSMRPAEAMNFGKFYMDYYYSRQYEDVEDYLEMTWKVHHWFGDPEMMLRTDEPTELQVGHDHVVVQGQSNDLTVTVRELEGGLPVEGALVCISNADTDEYLRGTTDVNGEVTFPGVTTQEVGDYDVVVTGYNAAPYEAIIASLHPDTLIIDADYGNPGGDERDDGDADSFALSRVEDYAGQGPHLEVIVNGRPAEYVPYAQLDEGVFVNGSRDQDTLTVVLSEPDTIPTGGIFFQGHDEGPVDNDSLVVRKDGSVTDAVCHVSAPGFGYLDLGGNERVDFGGLKPGGPVVIEKATPSGSLALQTLQLNLDDGLQPHTVDLLAEDVVDGSLQIRVDGGAGGLTAPIPSSQLTINLGVRDTARIETLPAGAPEHPAINVNGDGSSNSITLVGSPTDDTFTADPSGTTQLISTCTITAANFAHVDGIGVAGTSDTDVAELYATTGDEVLQAEHSDTEPDWAMLSNNVEDWSSKAAGFDTVYVHAANGRGTTDIAPEEWDTFDFDFVFDDVYWDGSGDFDWDASFEGSTYRWSYDSEGTPRLEFYPDCDFINVVVQGDNTVRTPIRALEQDRGQRSVFSLTLDNNGKVNAERHPDVHGGVTLSNGGGLTLGQELGETEKYHLRELTVAGESNTLYLADQPQEGAEVIIDKLRFATGTSAALTVTSGEMTITDLTFPATGAVINGTAVVIGEVVANGIPGLLTKGGVDTDFEFGEDVTYNVEITEWASDPGHPDYVPDPWDPIPGTGPVNDKIHADDGDILLGGTLGLTAMTKLHPPIDPVRNIQWYGEQARIVASADVGSSILWTFEAVPQPLPAVPVYGGDDDNWGEGHLGRGVFLTRQNDGGEDDQLGVSYSAAATKVHLFQAADGDTNGDRIVNSFDIMAILASGGFPNQPLPPGLDRWDWQHGDFDGNATVNSFDIMAILANNLFGTGPYYSPPEGGRGAPERGGPGGGGLRPGVPGGGGSPESGGTVDLIVSAGGLTVDTHGETLASWVFSSAAGVFTGDAASLLGLFREDTDGQIGSAFFTLTGQHFLGDVIGGEYGGVDPLEDLTLSYTLYGEAGTYTGNVIVDLGESAQGGGAAGGEGSNVDPFAWLYQLDPTATESERLDRLAAIAKAVDLLLTDYVS